MSDRCLTDPTDTAGWERAVEALEHTPVPFACPCGAEGVVDAGEATVIHRGGGSVERAEVVVHQSAPAYEFACPWCLETVLAVA